MKGGWTLIISISSNPHRLHWWSLSVLLSVLDFPSLVLVESEWLAVYLSTLFREFKMLRRRQQRQRQKSNRLRLCSHYSVNGIGPGRHKPFTHIETSRRSCWPRGFGALNSSPHSRIFTFVSEGSSPRSYLFISATGRIGVHTAPKCGTKPLRYVMLHFWDRRGATSLGRRNRAATTVLTCEQKPYRVWISWR